MTFFIQGRRVEPLGKAISLLQLTGLTVKFREIENLLGVLMQYEILGFCEFGLNQRGHQLYETIIT